MSLTLKDVVENQMRQRASGLRREAADTRSTEQNARERFSLDASDRPPAAASETRRSTADADTAKAQASRADATKRQDEPSRAGRSSDAKPETRQATRSDAAKKPTTFGQGDTSQSASASTGKAADGTSADATGGGLATSEQAGGDAAAAATAEAASAPVAPPIVALIVAPPAATPPPLTEAGGSASDEASEIDVAGTGASQGATASDIKTGAASATVGGGKSEFQAMLGDTAAASPGGDAGPSITAPSIDSAGTAGASTGPAEAKPAAAAHPQALAAASPPIPLGAVPMTIGLRALGTSNRFEIRLDPKELGRVDVSVDIDKETGTVGARLVVDRPETLALLQRDASSLQQALSQTGLDASAGISLSLRNDGTEGQRDGNRSGADAQGSGQPGRGQQAGTDQTPLDLVPLRALRGVGRVDIRI